MLEEVHVKLCRITKLDLDQEIDVPELRKEHVQQRAREQEKVHAGTCLFRLRALLTQLSRMFLLRLKEIRGLSVKMAHVSASILRIRKLRLMASPTLLLKG